MACDTPLYRTPKGHFKEVPIPCGKCPPCKKRRVNNWVFRLEQEDKIASCSHFVTLTYNTTHVPITPKGFMTLRKRDFQLFMKRLRKLNTQKLRYYLAGEYGTKTMRPHYHAIVYNIDDIEHFNTAWQLGTVHVGNVSGASISYTCKYIDKPKRIPMHKNDDRLREFSLMSKGLGKNYLTDEILKYHRKDPKERNYVTREDGVKLAMPRYYANKIFTEQELETIRYSVQQKVDQAEVDAMRQYYADNPNGDWEQRKANERFGRYTKFYKNQNPRS